MRQKHIIRVAGFAILLTVSSQAVAGLGQRIYNLHHGIAMGRYHSNNVIRVIASGDAHTVDTLRRNSLVKLAEMTREKGFSRFGITKSNCTRVSVYGSASSDNCRFDAQMVADGEAAQAKGNRTIEYFSVEQVLGNQTTG